MHKNQAGFGVIEIVIAVVVIIIIAAAGFIYFFKPSADTTTVTSKQTTSTDQKSSEKSDSSQFNWSGTPQGLYMDKIAYATSTDLLHWTDSAKVIAEHTSVPDVMVKDGVIYMYFVDINTDGVHEQIGLKTSSDKGTTWSDTTIVKISGAGDITAVDPDPFLLPDGRIRLYYYVTQSRDPNDTSVHSIYSAVSSDGKSFTQEAGVRFAKEQIVDPDVIKVGNTWRMYVGSGAKAEILSATSTDGLNFTYEGVAVSGSGVPNAYYDGNRYLMFSAGINLASSTDGKTYTSMSPGTYKAFPGADPGVVKLGSNNYLMVYKINGSTNQRHDPPVN